jgi:hypothetical protein
MNTLHLRMVAIFLAVGCACAQPAIHLKAGAPDGRSSRMLTRQGRATHFLLRFPTEPGAELRGELERRGMRVLQYVPAGGVMVASPTALDLHGLGVLSADTLEPSDKISPLLANQVTGAILIEFHADVDMAVAREEVRARGFDVLENPALLPGHLVASGAHSALEALAESDDVA